LFALAQLLLGQGVYAIRLLAIGACAVTAFFLAVTLITTTRSGLFPATCVAAIYALTSLSMGGLATNTELLMNGYFAVALAVFHRARMPDRFAPWQGCMIGLLLGMMFHTNYLGGFLIIGFGVGYLVAVIAKGNVLDHIGIFSKNVAALSIGFLGASFLILAPIAVWGNLNTYFSEQVAFLSVYRTSTEISLGRIFNQHQPYFAIISLYLTTLGIGLWKARRRSSWRHQECVFLLQISIYLIFGLIAISASGRFFGHYSILLLPGLTLAAGIFLASVPRRGTFRGQCAAWLLVLSVFLSGAPAGNRIREGIGAYGAWISGAPTSIFAEIAHDIESRAKSPMSVYLYRFPTIIYYLTGAKPPTRYLYHHLLVKYADAFDFEPAQEMARILGSRPQFIVARYLEMARERKVTVIFRRALRTEYELVKKYRSGKETVFLYERKDLAGADLQEDQVD
jgi:hypothetical protein